MADNMAKDLKNITISIFQFCLLLELNVALWYLYINDKGHNGRFAKKYTKWTAADRRWWC